MFNPEIINVLPIYVLLIAILINQIFFFSNKIKPSTIILISAVYFVSLIPYLLLNGKFYIDMPLAPFDIKSYARLSLAVNFVYVAIVINIWLLKIQYDLRGSILVALFACLFMLSITLILANFFIGILVSIVSLVFYSFVCFLYKQKKMKLIKEYQIEIDRRISK